MVHLRRFFELIEWHRLVPDADRHEVMTGGYGGRYESTYATCAWVPDGTLALCYLPVARTITVDLSKLKGPVQARWFDPTAGAYTVIPGSPFAPRDSHQFTPPEHNAAGTATRCWCYR